MFNFGRTSGQCLIKSPREIQVTVFSRSEWDTEITNNLDQLVGQATGRVTRYL